MVALLVIAISLFAISRSISTVLWHSSYLKEKTIANWVAQNQIALYRAKKTWNNTTNLRGEADMAGISWEWEMHISKTENPNVRKLDVDVFIAGSDDIKGHASGYVAKLL